MSLLLLLIIFISSHFSHSFTLIIQVLNLLLLFGELVAESNVLDVYMLEAFH